MAPLYKCFYSVRTVLYRAFLAFFVVVPAFASTPYTVEGVKVDVTAKNALEARDQAFTKAQVDAFTLLAKNLLPSDRAATFTAPDASTISGMIKDYEITEEKLSSVRYIGTYTFRFKEAPVHRFLGLMVTDPEYSPYGANASMGMPRMSSKGSLLILPFYRAGGNMLLWAPDNIWLKAWNSVIQDPSFAIPIGDLQDVSDIGDNQALTYDRAKLDGMVRRYGAGEAVLAVAIPDTPETGTLTVNIYRTDRGGPELTQKIFVTGYSAQNPDFAMREAVNRTLEALQGSWKRKVDTADFPSSPSLGPGLQIEPQPVLQAGNQVLGSVRFANLQEWAMLQRDLTRIPGVRQVALQSLSPREAIVVINYHGDMNALRNALHSYNVTLVGDQRPVGPAPVIPAPAPMPYEVYDPSSMPAPVVTAPPPPAPYEPVYNF